MSEISESARIDAIKFAKRLESLVEIAKANFPSSTDVCIKTLATANSASVTVPSWALSALLKAAVEKLEA